MKKIYLVYEQGCEPNGTIDSNSKKYLKFVFTNYKLAKYCAEYFNDNWRLGSKRNANFKKECISYYYVETRTICKTVFGHLPF